MCNIDHFLREPINSISHAAGAIASLVGLALLIVFSSLKGSVWHIVSFTIFGFTLVMMFTSSSLYHGLRISDAKLAIFRRIDHIMIFLLIAGTYTPVCVVPLRGAWGWSIFGVIWVCAILGIILKVFYIGRFEKISVAVYIIMGWLCVIAFKEIIANVSSLSIILLIIGGLSYTLGVIFFAWQKLPHNHALWHLCVLGGSVFHYFAVLSILWTI